MCLKIVLKNATWLYYSNKAYKQCKISCVSFVPILRELENIKKEVM